MIDYTARHTIPDFTTFLALRFNSIFLFEGLVTVRWCVLKKNYLFLNQTSPLLARPNGKIDVCVLSDWLKRRQEVRREQEGQESAVSSGVASRAPAFAFDDGRGKETCPGAREFQTFGERVAACSVPGQDCPAPALRSAEHGFEGPSAAPSRQQECRVHPYLLGLDSPF